MILIPDQGVIELRGAEGTDLLHRISTNDIRSCPAGGTVSTCFLNEKGRLIDVATIVVMTPESLLLFPSPGNTQGLIELIDRYIIMEQVTVIDVSAEWTVFVYRDAASELPVPEGNRCVRNEDGTMFFKGLRGDISVNVAAARAGSATARALRDGTTADYGSPEEECSRIMRGVAFFGAEITLSFNPYETGLTHLLNNRKGCYVGQEVIARLDTYDKIRKHLAGLLMPARPTHLPLKLTKDGKPVGVLTSCSPIPLGGRYPALAVLSNQIPVGSSVAVEESDEAFVVAPPFPIEADAGSGKGRNE